MSEEKKALTVQCPHCGKAVPWTPESRFRPFCCERCRLIDLGAWASENHRIPGDTAQPSPEDEEQ